MSHRNIRGKRQVRHTALEILGTLTNVSFIQPDNRQVDKVIVFIPGNPGAISFYDKFIEHLFELTQIPIYGISHAGHDLMPKEGELIKSVRKELHPNIGKNSGKVYSLEDQISYKVHFIHEYIKPPKKIILIAHSLGSYITLNILQKLRNPQQISQVILLFPVFERTMETVSGKWWVPLLHRLHKPMLALTKVMPSATKNALIDLIAYQRKFSLASVESISSGMHSLLSPTGIKNITKIAIDLSRIGDLGSLKDLIILFKKKLTFYYGSTDTWTPLPFYVRMKYQFPDVDVRLDDNGIEHAFVLKSSLLTARVVASILEEKLTDIYSREKNHGTFELSRGKKYQRVVKSGTF